MSKTGSKQTNSPDTNSHYTSSSYTDTVKEASAGRCNGRRTALSTFIAVLLFTAAMFPAMLSSGCGTGGSTGGTSQADVLTTERGSGAGKTATDESGSMAGGPVTATTSSGKADATIETDATKLSNTSDVPYNADVPDSTDIPHTAYVPYVSDMPDTPAVPDAAEISKAIEEARLLAASYDYDQAISKLAELAAYDKTGEVRSLIAELSSTKDSLQEADITAIPHIFFHSLIVYPSLAFHNDDARADDYNTAMTTVDEFNLIIRQLYDRGYVLVSLHQMAQFSQEADGTGRMTAGRIMLPPGKKPIVLSIDDMSYYAYMMSDGFATKLVIGPDGKLTNEMEKNDGTVIYGSYDVVPLLNDFIEAHPDFSYKGAKGAIALTGYDGVFGYRTDQDYLLKEHLLYEQGEWLKKHPDFDYEKDLAEAKAVAQALRDDGWELTSHGWGHRDMGKNPMDKFVTDMEKWIDRVESLIGETDILIYPFGADVETGPAYTMDNEKYRWLQEHGFHYFCTVNSEQPSVQLGDQYLRQGRINADGYMMYHFPEKLMPFFDVASVFDSSRPTPVPKY
jgi:peptidoglycan/xylan/chitin deacetylase (PgdA/CDA1 family)